MSRGHVPILFLAAATLVSLAAFYTSTMQSPEKLSPQGCRMSYMSPSYILQTDFDFSWTRLARRYSLWLYREVGWDSNEKLVGTPVLFIPGHAGSSRQIRSIASSATRQYYSEPHKIHTDFLRSPIKPLDFFAVDFNEDFSALHGPTLLSEREYSAAAVVYILSLYPPQTEIILMGHSMGGIVALSLLPDSNISAVITMSTPYSLPPARLDKRIENIYAQSWDAFRNDATPILSICGGATDLMIPSETCSMGYTDITEGYKSTVFTTCMEGTWTGVGHREMVWCHQVRWRVARAALELGIAKTNAEKGSVLTRWFRDMAGQIDVLQSEVEFLGEAIVTSLPIGHRLILRNIPGQSSRFDLPLPPDVSTESRRVFVLYVSRGTVASISPHHISDLNVSVYMCHGSSQNCNTLKPTSVRLMPNPFWGSHFPVPGEGVDESDGVVCFTAILDNLPHDGRTWISVFVRGGADPKSWVLGGIEENGVVKKHTRQFAPLWNNIDLTLDPKALTTTIHFPNLLRHSLLVYHIHTVKFEGSCTDALLPPILVHRSSPSESYFHPTDGVRRILLHTHASGPFISSKAEARQGINLTIYSSGECGISQLRLTVDWWTSLGSWGLRYWTTICAWAVGIVGILVIQAWYTWEKGASFPSVNETLTLFVVRTMLPLGMALFLLSCIPGDTTSFLGNAGEIILAPLAPLVLVIASGCVTISWGLLQCIMWFLSRFISMFGCLTEETRIWRRNLWSLAFILLLVGTVVPSQVAFLVSFLIHLFACSVHVVTSAVPAQADAYAQKSHILLLLFWLLPMTAPVLVVWVRTLATAGLTAPFDGDHDILAVASFLLLVDFASRSSTPLFIRSTSKPQYFFTSCALYSLSFVPFVFGGRYTYRVYTTSNLVITYIVLAHIGSRIWSTPQ